MATFLKTDKSAKSMTKKIEEVVIQRMTDNTMAKRKERKDK